MLSKVKIMLGITDTTKDDLISLLIDLAKEEATSFCNLSEYAEELDSIVIRMVVQNYNKNGNEGIASASYSGVSESYLDNYSQDVIKSLKKHRRLITL